MLIMNEKITGTMVSQKKNSLDISMDMFEAKASIIVSNHPDEQNIKTSILLYGDIPNEMYEERTAEEAYFQRCLELTTKKLEDKNVVLFPDKTKNLHGYPLFLMAVHTPPSLLVNESKEGLDKYKGKDADLIKLLGERMNFTIKHRKALTQINKNPVFEHIITGYMQLSLGMFDISSNIIFLTDYPFPPIDYIYPIEGGGLCFLTHRAGEISMIVNSLRIFKVEVFVLVAISMVILSFLTQVYLQQETKLQTWDRWGTAISYIYRLFLSYPIPFKSKTDTLRFLIITTVCSTFVLDYMVQSQLVYNLYTRPLKKQINTLRDLYESGLIVEGFPSPDAMLPLTSEVNKKLNDRFASMDTLLECSDYLRTHHEKACWLECNIASDLARTHVDDSGKLSFHLGKEKNHDFYLVYPVPKGSPLKTRITHYTKKIFECGLMLMWREASLNAKPEDTPEVKAISMKDMEGIFLNTLISGFFGILVFVIELIVGKCCSKK